ncbi:hypothetical protein LIER_35373 [Lithospermum erythrorhizon]|uniref:Uncharacterized protein n=1 Tax=Lithospermum erythrorhizon TaxID=34254 RepID=A0AAV3NR72_LITER
MAMNKSHTRSISLPSRSHPITLQIEEQLNKIGTFEASSTSEAVSNGLCALVELYKSMDDLLNLPQTLQTLIKNQNAKCVDEILECPVTLLDVCGITIDVMSQLKENIRDLQSSMRRRKGDLSVETCINKYRSFNKKMKKDAKKCIATLKKMDQAMEVSILDVDQEVSSVIRLIKKVNACSISALQHVLGFLSTSSKSKLNKWLFSRLIVNKQRVACESQQISLNELEVVENSLSTKSATIQEDLEKLEASIEGIERGLECMTRSLIKSRTILLNVVSC